MNTFQITGDPLEGVTAQPIPGLFDQLTSIINGQFQQPMQRPSDLSAHPSITQKSEYQFGLNFGNILGSQAIQSIASLLSHNSPNSQSNAIKRFNQQYNNLPYTPNNSLQDKFGSFRKGGTVRYDEGGPIDDTSMEKWIFEEKAPDPSVDTNKLDRAVQKVVMDISDEQMYNQIS